MCVEHALQLYLPLHHHSAFGTALWVERSQQHCNALAECSSSPVTLNRIFYEAAHSQASQSQVQVSWAHVDPKFVFDRSIGMFKIGVT